MFGALQQFVFIGLGLIVFAVQVVALVDAIRRPAHAYKSEGKLSKPIWLAILGAAAAFGLLGLPPSYFTADSFLNVIAVVPAIIYWADVRPRLQPYGTGNKPRGPQGGW
ncbi:DUF2516 family protein [Promicromonospora soli]|uniref:DUF2516 family protein n=1 Tax=Promicromonospora soli TaxID=2035533 RepID=A0A919G2D8_9MICO|nr:DUF2516 family protein [Promicromonospora soli]GHH76802.1 hypothetical protein GCM10017772_36360 [Promicromonospora soli]